MVNQPITPPTTTKKPKDKKWLLWGLIGFTGILLVTAVILFLQLKKPAAPLPTPKASPTLPTVKQVQPENVCQVSFSVPELKCTGITLDPTGTAVTAKEKRKLTSQVTGGSGTYTHSWTVATNKTNKGTLSSTTTNPTNWTAPDSLTEPQEWTIKDTVTDTSTTKQTASCETKLSFTGLTACFDTCDNDTECETDLRCMTVGGEKRCVNPGCTEETDCACASPGPSPSPSPKASVKPSPSPEEQAELPEVTPPSGELAEQPTLPEAGVNTPVILGVSVGILLMILGLLF